MGSTFAFDVVMFSALSLLVAADVMTLPSEWDLKSFHIGCLTADDIFGNGLLLVLG
jgi:hypothetical protein